MDLSALLAALPGYQLLTASGPITVQPGARCQAVSPVTISQITADSRQVEPGALFVAYPGVSVDGRRFIPQAAARGAAAIVAEAGQDLPADISPVFVLVPDGREALAYLAAAWHNFPARQLTMVGITGTDGKTTTTNLLYAILRAGAQKAGMISTVNAVIGDTVLDTGLHTTTPDAPDVQAYLARMAAAGTNVCLLEVTSHAMAQHRVTACDFDVAIVTNITHEHLDLHGTRDVYWAAKARLFESLAAGTGKGIPKTAVLNCDDDSFAYLKQRIEPLGIPWLGYSLAGHPQAALAVRDVIYRPDKTTFSVHWRDSLLELETALMGDYNVSNCLAAATAALELLGVSAAAVQAGVAGLTGVPGRMERVDAGQPFTAIVDFAHTPNSLRRALTTVRAVTPGRVLAVFGCAGLRDVKKRTLMGEIAAELADMTILTAEDPRTESPEVIMAETARAMVASGGVEGQTFERQPDRGRAIYRAVQLAGPGDTVIALGKGHEQSMCFGQTEYPWDDRAALRSALKGQPLLTLPSAKK